MTFWLQNTSCYVEKTVQIESLIFFFIYTIALFNLINNLLGHFKAVGFIQLKLQHIDHKHLAILWKSCDMTHCFIFWVVLYSFSQ